MTTRYYKATDGTFTVFRATQSREYASAWIQVDGFKVRPLDFGFRAKSIGPYPAIEINKADYEWLATLKNERTTDHSPRNSWVRNDALNPTIVARIVGLDEEAAPVPPKAHDRIDFEEAAPPVDQPDPTKVIYLNLVQAYDYLNERLWSGKLPTCLVTLQRKANTRGYFAGARFASRDGAHKVDEIALNPSTFKERDTREILSTLAHEMCHLEQHHYGRPGKGGYHNREWGGMMKAIGLQPVSVDQPGKEVGNKVTHTIIPGGHFDGIIDALIESGAVIDYVEAWTEEGKAKASKKLKVKYSCPQCGVNCWAKPDAHFVCGDCDEAMEAEEG
jgi:hypothetical protein